MDSYPVNRLFNDPPHEDEIQAVLSPAGFSDWRGSFRLIQRMARLPGARPALQNCLEALLPRLHNSANPDTALTNLERFAGAVDAPGDLFQFLADNPRTVEILVVLFSGSQFLTEILLRRPKFLDRLAGDRSLAQRKTVEDFLAEARAFLTGLVDPSIKLDALRRFQHWELLRIGTCDLIGLLDLVAVTGQLSALAESMVQMTLEIVSQQVSPEMGATGLAVIAMGKLGGRELNYSSDIDLLFVCQKDEVRVRRIAEKLIDGLAKVTAEGFLYRVDMRLRPWGRAGVLAPTIDSYLSYLQQQARLWEKQALLKAHYIAGDPSVGADFLDRITSILLNFDPEEVRKAVYEMKQRTEAHLREQGRDWGEVKLGEGSIRDIEFVVQYLQLGYGGHQPEIRSRSTLEALPRLTQYGLLTSEESRALTEGYLFFRTVEHHLQMMHYRQTYTLPADKEAQTNLARRLGFQEEDAQSRFLERYEQHRQAVRTLFLRQMGRLDEPKPILQEVPEIRRHLDRMDPSYEAAFSPMDISHHATLAGQLNETRLACIDAVSLEDNCWRVTVVAYDYPGILSIICGLMFVYEVDILNGNVFTYEPLKSDRGSGLLNERQKIVDVFTIRSSRLVTDEMWAQYSADLEALFGLMQAGQRQEARTQLARRAAGALHGKRAQAAPLYPIEIEIDNDISPRYTVLRISSQDTIGFLYELTNALAINRIYIAQVEIETTAQQVRDTLYVTDAAGSKITDPQKERELRAATVLTKHFTHLLPRSPDPETALLHFHEFTGELFRHPNWPAEIASLENPEVLGGLAELLGVSQFLWDDFLRMQHANLFPVVSEPERLATAKTRSQIQAELESVLRPIHPGPQAPTKNSKWQIALNEFKDREMFRVDMRHILGHTQEFWEFSEELTALSEVVVNSAYHLTAEDLRSVFGTPRREDGTVSQMCVVALGKCGGRELGFASDIELMFIYDGNGMTDGSLPISSAEFHERVVEGFLRAIYARREGIFEVDLQLRPYGKAGSLAVSLDAFKRYFAPDGAAWAYERQALVRLRRIGGDEQLGQRVESLRDEYVYTDRGFDVTAMHAMRQRQIRHLVMGGTFNPKFSPGGLVDLEYLVQGLQITYGLHNPALRTTNTREAMAKLMESGILSEADYTLLRKAYTFLRWLIDGLRMVAGNAKDLVVPPAETPEFSFLARRMRYGEDVQTLREDLSRYSAFVEDINRRLLPG